ncbi:hypothetical protein MMC07_005466 [Pseudocyphellaria aurata]|nr:hypothetical protein [Pseudocyphellaria aurata]
MSDQQSSVASKAGTSRQASRTWEDILKPLAQQIDVNHEKPRLQAIKNACQKMHDYIITRIEKPEAEISIQPSDFPAVHEDLFKAFVQIWESDWQKEDLEKIRDCLTGGALSASYKAGRFQN